MKYYPIFLDIRGKRCVVIGGGGVAERKIESLLEAGAEVQLISPEITPPLKELSSKGKISFIRREFKPGDLKGFFIAFIATNDKNVGMQAHKEAEEESVLLNVVDTTDLCNFIVPSTVAKGDLLIAISTGGKSPALARSIREELENRFGNEFEIFLQILGLVREKLLTTSRDSTYNKKLFQELVSSPIIELIRDGKNEEIDRVLLEVMGEGYSLSELKVEIKKL